MRRFVVFLVAVAVASSCQPGKTVASTSPRSTPTTSRSPYGSPLPTPSSLVSFGGVVEYPVPRPGTRPAECAPFCHASLGSLALGADGNVWFTDVSNQVVGRITPAGDVKQYSVAPLQLNGGARTIAAGPDGNMWVTASGGGANQPDWILRITPTGQITQLTAGVRPSGLGQFGTGPESIAAGPDGNMWFTEFWTNRVGRLSPSGDLAEFPIPTQDSSPRGIVMGPDGNVWFVESTHARPAIARITTAGAITEFPLSSAPADLYPDDIIAGPDGNLWFTDAGGIARISTRGDVVPVVLPTGTSPGDLVVGPDRKLWFTDPHGDYVGRLDLNGGLRKFPLPRRDSWPAGIAVGADARIWFAESFHAAIAAIGVRVPEVLMNRRPLVFLDSSTKTVNVRNTGESPLTISATQLAGVDASLFAKGADTCAGASIAPDASCSVELRHLAGGPSGIQSALLEISDNATASPQRLSLLAQVPHCVLPVTAGGDANTLAHGEQLDVSLAQVLYDANGGFEQDSAASAVRTTPLPGLLGPGPGYFDRALGRWLPVTGPEAVSPDGSRYAYVHSTGAFQGTEIRVVDIARAAARTLAVPPNFWHILRFTAAGIYLNAGYDGIAPGLWLLNPDTGAFKSVFSDGRVAAVDGSMAWLPAMDPADALPNPAPTGFANDEILRRDLVSGATTVWLYRPGTDVYVAGVANGSPVVDTYDGFTTTFWIVTAANQAQKIEFPFDLDPYPSPEGFLGDSNGVWVGGLDGVFLWTPRTGTVLMTDQVARPAGTCA